MGAGAVGQGGRLPRADGEGGIEGIEGVRGWASWPGEMGGLGASAGADEREEGRGQWWPGKLASSRWAIARGAFPGAVIREGASRGVGQLAVGQFVTAGGILRRSPGAGVNPQRGAPMGEREVRASNARAGGRRVD